MEGNSTTSGSSSPKTKKIKVAKKKTCSQGGQLVPSRIPTPLSGLGWFLRGKRPRIPDRAKTDFGFMPTRHKQAFALRR